MGSFYASIVEELDALDGSEPAELAASYRVVFGADDPPGAPPPVKIQTVIAALRQAAKEMGYTLSDSLASLMIGQLRGAEGAFPGAHTSLGGTNNMGAAQAPPSLAKMKQGLTGWGAFAHLDSDPARGKYIGWYYIAPSALEAARHWLGKDNWWGPALLKANPQTPEDYATILYQHVYFQGMHAEPTGKPDPTSDAGQANIADYAKNMRRGMATAPELSTPGDDPSVLSVDPTMFKPLDKRQVTKDLYDKAKSGGIGSAWASFLPPSWDDLVASNGVAWFGPPPYGAATAAVTGLMAKAVRYPIRAAALILSIVGVVGTGVIYATGGMGGGARAPVGRRRQA